MLRRLDHSYAAKVRLVFEGRQIEAMEGDSVAAALLAEGEPCFRSTPVSGAPRGPYCMMGVCFECLVEIDGVANRQACMTQVREGMQIRRQNGRVQIGEALR